MSGGGSSSSGNKRKYQDSSNNHRRTNSKHRNPKRGGPGVLLTCETGREGKCRREGIQILQHYFSLGLAGGGDDKNNGQLIIDNDGAEQTKNDSTSSSASLSLEEELKLLRSKKTPSSKFSPYETGSKGSVFLMCTAEGCQMIPPIQVDDDNNQDDGDNGKKPKDDNKEGDKDDTGAKRAKKQRSGDDGSSAEVKRTDDEGGASAKSDAADSAPSGDANITAEKEDGKKTGTNPWDPVPVVRKVFADVEQNDTSAPGSRFVTRMIPIQATCFASAAEIKATSEALLQKFFFPVENYASFAVAVQKRICNNVKKPEIIEIIAGRILDNSENNNSNNKKRYKVSLDNPDVTIVVEIVRTLCGIAIVPRPKELPNKFSLVVAREKAAAALQSGDEE